MCQRTVRAPVRTVKNLPLRLSAFGRSHAAGRRGTEGGSTHRNSGRARMPRSIRVDR
jgi:hypothetical protein